MPRHALPDSASTVNLAPRSIDAARHRRRHAAAASTPRRRRALPEPAPVTPIIPAPRRAADDAVDRLPFDVASYADTSLYTHEDLLDEPPVAYPAPVVVERAFLEPVIEPTAVPADTVEIVSVPVVGRSRHRMPPKSRRTALRVPRPGGKRKQTAAVLVATAAGIIGVPAAGAAASAPVDDCKWMRAAHQLVVALDDGAESEQAKQLRKALDKAGVGPELPQECVIDTTQYLTPVIGAAGEDAGAESDSGTEASDTEDGDGTEAPATPAPSGPKHAKPEPAPAPAPAAKPEAPQPVLGTAPDTAGAGTTAAEKFGWGTPIKHDDFSSGLDGWNVYDSEGHAGNGRRTPDAASAANGMLTISGDPSGNTAGMAWGEGQQYGRWEGRVKAPVSDESYNALLLLWPDAENFPVGGEIDFMEMMDHTRQTTNMFLHYGESNNQVDGEVNIDATQWHNWAVEWTPDHVAAFVDGKEWFRTTDKSILPPGPMHLCIQLDWFPGDGEGDVQHSQMQVDWVKQYAL